MNLSKSLRIAIIGCGAVARQLHIPALKKLGYSPVLFVDYNLDSAKELQAQFPGSIASGNTAEHFNLFDAAIVCTPNSNHFAAAKELLLNGKHVLMEKPVTTTVQELDDLEKIAQKRKLIIHAAMMRRYWNLNIAIRELIQEGALGKLKTLEMLEGNVFHWKVKSAAVFDKKLSGGGVLLDTGSHTLDLATWLTSSKGKDIEYCDDNINGVESECEIQMTLAGKDAIKTHIKLSRIRNLPNTYTLAGVNGWIEWIPYSNQFRTSGTRLTSKIHSKFSKKILKDQGFSNLFESQLIYWIKALTSGLRIDSDIYSARDSIEIIEHCYNNRHNLKYPWEND
jgi:predicted dehydrogenase